MMDEEVEGGSNTKYKDGVNRNARLIVRNISFKATEKDLRDHFSSYGTVEEIKLLKKPDGKLVGCGFVHYTQVPMANKAIASANKKPFLGRPISVSWAVPKHKYGQSSSASSGEQPDVTADDNKDKVKAMKSNTRLIKEEKPKVRINRNARLIVRNISFKATEETLKEHFEPYGTLEEVKILKKPDGKLVGCAFVHFKNVPMAKKALLNTNMKPFLGRPISVDWAIAKNKYMQHVVTQQFEMEEQVKKEESDSDDDDGPPMNISSEDMKQEVKSESDDESVKKGSSDEDIDSDTSEKSNENVDDSDDEEEDVPGNDDEEQDDQSITSSQAPRQRIKLNDAEDGCTVFVTNIPFSVDNHQLQEFAERTGRVNYALVCVDKLTEHSKGTGFVKFLNKEDADTFLSLPADQLRLDGQTLHAKPALKRENLQKDSKKEPKDNRNLYLVKEGVVVAGTKSAVGVSASDMAKRLTLERSKTQMLKNLNRFVSRYRLVVSNLPGHYDDGKLRATCARAAGARAVITECRVMRDLRAQPTSDNRHPSKGYGFVMFTRHEDAIACLRKLNNNPDVFDKNNRPIVSFSIEDRTALNARKKRLEKSIANNPLANQHSENNDQGENSKNRRNRKRKLKFQPDESYVKKGRFEKNNEVKHQSFGEPGRFVKKPTGDDTDDFSGLTAKEGSQHKIRSNQKLRTQAEVHRQNVKLEKKKSKKTLRLKMAAKERVKLPKQKINTNKTGKRNKHRFRDRNVF